MQILKQLSEAMGVSGAEGEVRRAILDLVSPHVDDVRVDRMGNVIAFKAGTDPGSDFKVMVTAHMDEIGMMVNGYDGNGMLKVAAIGGLDARLLPGQRVLVGSDKIPGVIGAKPVHLVKGGERTKAPEMSAIRIDIGASGKDSAKGKAKLGDRVGFDSRFMDLGEMLRGRAFDDRVGCAVLVHLLQGNPFLFDLYGVFTVQEEVGKAGARVAAYAIQPNVGFVLEGTIADDLPQEEDEDRSQTTIIGKGPALSAMDYSTIYDPRLNGFLIRTADEIGISYQFKQPGVGGTDASELNRTGIGVPVAAVSVPCRYIHSPAAMLSMRDYENTVTLMREALSRLTPDTLAR